MDKRNRNKTTISIEIDDRLLAHTREYNIDITSLVRESLKNEVARRWTEENAEAFKLNSERIEREGLWSDKFRNW
jgi:post-segregation antitoxin (ccd killing protein)